MANSSPYPDENDYEYSLDSTAPRYFMDNDDIERLEGDRWNGDFDNKCAHSDHDCDAGDALCDCQICLRCEATFCSHCDFCSISPMDAAPNDGHEHKLVPSVDFFMGTVAYENVCEHSDHDCDQTCEACVHCQDCDTDTCETSRYYTEDAAGCRHGSIYEEDDENHPKLNVSGTGYDDSNKWADTSSNFEQDKSMFDDRNPKSGLKSKNQMQENAGKKWTLDADMQLVNDYLNGHEFDDMAKRQGRTSKAVYGRLKYLCFEAKGIDTSEDPSLNLPIRDLRRGDFTQIEVAWRAGSDLTALAVAVGVAKRKVVRELLESRLAIPIDPSLVPHYSDIGTGRFPRTGLPWLEDEIQRLLNLARQKEIEEISNSMKRSPGAIVARLFILGVISEQDVNELLKKKYLS